MACEVVVTDEAKEDLEAAVLYLTESLVPLRQRATCWTPSMALWSRSRRFR